MRRSEAEASARRDVARSRTTSARRPRRNTDAILDHAGIAGWLLILLGLYVLFGALVEVTGRPNPRIFSAPFWLIVGFIIFRGGIHLLKVAVAARVCLHAERQLARQAEKNKRQVVDKSIQVMSPEW